MIKKIAALCMVSCISGILFAYNPPVSGESIDTLTSPTQLTYASSSTGGAIFSAGPDSIVFNPALIANELRIGIDVGFTALFSTLKQDKKLGAGFETGIVIPTKYLVVGTLVKGTFLPFQEMHVKNIIGTNVVIAKEISERLSVGIGLNGGVFWGAKTDWQLAASLGAMYRIERLGFMRDFRIGFSVLDLGKNFTKTTLPGINPNKAVGWFPMLGTTKAGVSALLLSNEHVKLGLSLDLTTPGFQNLIISTGLHFSVKDIFFIRIAEEINIREAVLKNSVAANYMPAIGMGVRFSFKSGKGEYMEDKGWAESEMTINTSWKQLYKTVNAISAGVKIDVGQDDKNPPKIELWFDEEDE